MTEFTIDPKLPGASWEPELLAAIDGNDEIRVAPLHVDGTSRPAVIVWAVAVDGDLFARSARGPQGRWYRDALGSGRGRILVAGAEYDVAFADASSDTDQAAIDAAYHAKYDRYGARIVGSVVGEAAQQVTVRIASAS